MLVLSRKEHQSILIGEDIEVTIVRASNGTIRVGIVAPRDVLILRAELNKKEDDALRAVHK